VRKCSARGWKAEQFLKQEDIRIQKQLSHPAEIFEITLELLCHYGDTALII
jgi:hypothetical protein